MRKIYVVLGILLVMAGLLVNSMFGYDTDVQASDTDIAMMHATKVHGDRYENINVIICDDTNDEYIHYECYINDEYLDDYQIYRVHAYDCLTGYYDNMQD